MTEYDIHTPAHIHTRTHTYTHTHTATHLCILCACRTTVIECMGRSVWLMICSTLCTRSLRVSVGVSDDMLTLCTRFLRVSVGVADDMLDFVYAFLESEYRCGR